MLVTACKCGLESLGVGREETMSASELETYTKIYRLFYNHKLHYHPCPVHPLLPISTHPLHYFGYSLSVLYLCICCAIKYTFFYMKAFGDNLLQRNFSLVIYHQYDMSSEKEQEDLLDIPGEQKDEIIDDVYLWEPKHGYANSVVGELRGKCKETEQIEKYQPWQDEIGKLWGMRKVMVTPVVIGALGAVSKGFEKHIKNIGATIRLKMIQKSNMLCI
uniref:Uncharacterized protein n=1 Tax=Octopus bimaculoides TaxID=37653 RepID=A0A0L8I6F5_OCTBM